MHFQNHWKLLIRNFNNVYRLLVYKLVVALITSALCVAFILPQIMEIFQSEPIQAMLQDLHTFIRAFLTMNDADLNSFKATIFGENGSIQQATKYLIGETSSILFSCLIFTAILLVKHFVELLCYFSIGGALNDKMNSYAETPFIPCFIANFGKASLFALVYVPFSLLFNVATILLCGLCLMLFPILLAMFLSVTIIVIMQAWKMTVTGFWIPGMTADKKSLREALRKETNVNLPRGRIFSNYILTIYLIIIVNVLALLCTFGSALLITVPTSYVLLLCQQYVDYYTVHGKKYFVSYEEIESNVDHGDRKHFFEYIEEEEKQAVLTNEPTQEERKAE